MSQPFGKTWWGAQWLHSLAYIDHNGRLSRGSSDAKKGAVRSFEMQGNTITASVKGTRAFPHRIMITLPPFSEEEVEALVAELARKPAIVSKLLNRELDPEVLQIAQQKGLNVFPQQWRDFQMNCSCSDWIVPCKHMSAVIYQLSSEIDNNPFLIFQLHNVDLLKEFEKIGVPISTGQIEAVGLKRALGVPETLPDLKKKAPSVEPLKDAEWSFLSADFSVLPPLTDTLVQLLPAAPAFYRKPGDFREKYAFMLRRAGRNAVRILNRKAMLDDMYSLPGRSHRTYGSSTFSRLINHSTSLQLSVNEENHFSVRFNGEPPGFQLVQLIPTLWAIPAPRLPDYHPSVAALRTLLLFSIHLIANGAVTPQILLLNHRRYHIRWLPALLSNEVRSLVERFEALLPQNLLLWKDTEPLNRDRATSLTSAFLNAMMRYLVGNRENDMFLSLFFDGISYSFHLPGEEALPGSICTWLQRYFITQGKYRPCIVVDEWGTNQFRVSINVENNKRVLAKAIPLREILNRRRYDKFRFEALQSLTLISPFIPGLDQYINSGGRSGIIMNSAEFTPFLMQAIPVIRLLNINVLLPKALREMLRPKVSVRIGRKQKEPVGDLRLEKLLDFEWQVALGDTVMSEAEFNAVLAESTGLIKCKAEYIYVSPDDLNRLQKHFSTAKPLSPGEMLRTALSNDYYGAKVALTDEVKALIEQLTRTAEIPLPQALHAQLRPYQKRGFSWMYRNAKIGFGSIIADDMGLGKTLQVITLLLKLKEEGLLTKEKALIVAPTGLLANWQAEVEKFAPSLTVKLYHGVKREREAADDDYDVLLTSYGTARSDALTLKKKRWYAVIIDEAQNIKNYEAEQSKAIKSIPAETFIAMSGTPVENRLSELWSIMDFCNRRFFGTLGEFRETFANPIQDRHDVAAANKLKTVTAPFMIRRLKSDKTIIDDLPDKIEIDSFARLVKEQAGLYEKTLHEAMRAIENIDAADHQSLFIRQGLVLQMILALKQICNHPTHFLKNNVLDASLSGKMDLLFSKLDTIMEANEKVLVFTQFTEMGRLLQHFITERFGEKPLFYHGGCSLTQRKEMVEAFQSNPNDKLFILSLKAAGTGLNLTAARHVIHYDLWWNPAVEAQATDRAYRIGQRSNVMVHRFITKGTFEERINEMIQRKKDLANLTIATGESWIGNLSNRELRTIFELGNR
jgi:uncharacterized Zn finger protein/superfamily II DNA or RNA helicase